MGIDKSNNITSLDIFLYLRQRLLDARERKDMNWALAGSVLLLALHWRGPNAVWGGASFGIVIGLAIGLLTGRMGSSARMGFVIGIALGAATDLVWYLSKRNRPTSGR